MRFTRIVVFAAAAAACAPVDTAAPPNPDVEPLPSQTALGALAVQGTAEYGAKIEITRVPAFAADEGPIPRAPFLTADAFTGRWRATIPLAIGQNDFSFFAVDEAGNKSIPEELTVFRDPRHADTLALMLDAPSISADDGALEATAQIAIYEPNVSLKDLEVRFEVVGYPLPLAAQTAVTDSLGRARVTFTGLTKAGDIEGSSVTGESAGTLIATAVIPKQIHICVFDCDTVTGEAAVDQVPFSVVPGEPAAIAISLNGNLPSVDNIQVAPGTPIAVMVGATDAESNFILDELPRTLWTDAPGAIVVGDAITGVTAAGTWHVVVTVLGTFVSDEATFTVLPGAGDRLVLELAAPSIVAGTTQVARAYVADEFGNRIGAAVVLAEEVPAWNDGGTDVPQDFANVTTEAGMTRGELTVRTAGAFTVTATADGLTETAGFTVVAAAPAAVTVDAGSAPLIAGTALTLSAEAADAFGNPARADFAYATDAPGAIVIGDTILGLTRASPAPYHAYAQVIGTSVTGSTTFGVVAAEAHHLALSLSAVEVSAGTAITATASLRDQYQNILAGGSPALSSDAGTDRTGAPQSFANLALTGGVRTGTLAVKSTASSPVTVTASGGGVAAATASFTVVPDAPFAFSFELDAATGEAGDPIGFHYSLTDAFFNPTHTPVIVTVSAPNVVVFDDGFGQGEIAGLIRAGSYPVSARAVGTNLQVETETVVIEPNPGEGFNLILSGALVAEGSSFLAAMFDAFGNVIDPADVTFTYDQSGLSVNAKGVFTALLPGTYSIKACLTLDSNRCDTEFIGVQGILDTVPPSVRVVVDYPDPSIKDTNSETVVPLGSRIAFHIESSDDRGLSQLSWFVLFGPSGTCSKQSTVPILLPGGTKALSPPLAVSATAPGCAQSLDLVTIVAVAEDETGNRRNSSAQQDAAGNPVVLRMNDRFNLTLAPGFIATVEASGDRLSTPWDVVRNGAGGPLVVSNRGNDRAVLVFDDRSQADMKDAGGGTIGLDVKPRGVAIDSAGNLYFGLDDNNGNGRIARVTSSLVLSLNFVPASSAAINDPVYGLALDEGSQGTDGTPLPARLCGAVYGTHRVICTDLAGAVQVTCDALAGSCTNTLSLPTSSAFGPASPGAPGGWLYVANDERFPPSNPGNTSNSNGRISAFKFTSTERTALTFVGFISTGLSQGDMGDLLYAPGTNNLLLADYTGKRLVSFPAAAPATPTLTEVARGFDGNVFGLAWDGNAVLLVDVGTKVVFRIAPNAPGAQF